MAGEKQVRACFPSNVSTFKRVLPKHLLQRFRNQGVELDSDSKPPRVDFGCLCPFPASPTPSPAASPPVPRSEVVRVPPRTSRIACGAASAPATLSGPSERTSPGDCGRYVSPDRHSPCWVPRPLPARAQGMPLRPDPCGGRSQLREQSREVAGPGSSLRRGDRQRGRDDGVLVPELR